MEDFVNYSFCLYEIFRASTYNKGVLRQHEVGGLKQFEGAERDVSKVAHRRGHEIEFSHAAKV